MKLEDRCLKEFDSVIRARGEDDFLSRAVGLELESDTAAQFQVRGKETVTVIMDWSPSAAQSILRASCSCRSFDKGEFCQHIWSTILEMDRGGLGEEIGDRQSRLSLTRLQAGYAVPLSKPARHLMTVKAGWKTILFKRAPLQDASNENSKRPLFFLNLEQSKQTGLLTLELRFQERTKSGEWGAIKSGQFDPYGIDAFSDASDREILGLLLSPLNTLKASRKVGVTVEQRRKISDNVLEVDPLLMDSILPKLISSQRLFLNSNDQGQVPLTFGENEWQFTVEVNDATESKDETVAKTENDGFVLNGVLLRHREKIAVKADRGLVLFSSGYFLLGHSIERTNWGRNFEFARYLCNHSVYVPREDETEFVTAIDGDVDFPAVLLPGSLQWPFSQMTPQALARFQKIGDSALNFAFSSRVVYENLEIEFNSSRKVLLDPAKRIRIKRDLKTEKIFFSCIRGPQALSKLKSELVKAGELPELIQDLQLRGWLVELDHQPVIRLSRTCGSLRKSGDDFQLDIDFDFNGSKVSLADFFASCARGERFLRLDGVRIGFLSDKWVERIDLLLRGGILDKAGMLRFKRSSIPLFKPVFDEIADLEIDEEVAGVYSSLESLSHTGQADKPRELKASLRPYQGEGLAWLERVAKSGFGGILADDMGLGKTIQVIAYLLRRATLLSSGDRTGVRPSLVVVPKSLVFNWLNEIEKFGPRLRVLDFAGQNRGMLKANDYDVVLTTYHTLKNELDRFVKIDFDTIILDEAQTIKNPSAQIAQAVFSLRGANHFALTGTPIENSLSDLFSLLKFANPGLIPKGVEVSIGGGRPGSLSKVALERLAIAVSPFILRRTKKQVLTELPDKCEQALACDLEGEQKKMYDRLRRHYRDSLKKEIAGKGIAGAKMQVLEALLRLRQACCHPGLVDKQHSGGSSAKFEMLLEHLEEIRASGHKALIFSQFTTLLELLKPHLEKANIAYEYLDGKTRDRGAVVDRFNSNSSITAFLISLKAGGTGLNLTTASYVFLLDPWWNPAVEAQAIDRAYRMGQKQKVMAYRLIAKGTIEEKIMRLQDQKRSLADAVISDDQSFLRTLSVDDLAGLLED